MSKIFQNLELDAFRAGITPRTRESRNWFRNKAQQLRRVNRDALMNEEPIKKESNEVIGGMYMFYYDPKTKATLPYYDKFPLVVIVGPAKGGFYGLNLHYLPPTLRARFLDSLLDITNNDKYDDSTKFKLSYGLLKRASKFKYFKPCIKHYLTDHVRSRFARVSAPEWEIAVFLPTASWAGSTSNAVYKDSRRMIN
jgi:hypothetical protein